MTEKTPEQQEIETLREHNADLLADLKKVRKKLAEAVEHSEALSTERDTAQGDLRRLMLEKPVNAMLDRVAVLPKHFRTEFESRGYRFELDNENVVIRDTEGNPAMIDDREATFTEADIKDLVLEGWKPEKERSDHVENFAKLVIGSRASGGVGTGTGHAPKPAPERLPTGLR
ncbi:hypothetical protein [Kineobactrum salinum]|uniref:Uncharacterized protein n=1 Tax=Kineobactrum salinum TaxID=2708301 RepID=A0A6C0U4B3_9GAMM|nr:hypothetical protein [Kineobactrum salinum]QIB66972.1 hypothetical protein G3T16_17835 [Kineobactrum salinum]